MKKPDKAIALKMDDLSGIPAVVARAKGILVEKIISIAENNNIEVYRDQDLAETLFAIDTGREIPVELYKPVVEVLLYCYSVNSSLKEKIDSKFRGKQDK